jgi:hypothetical protein
MPLMSNVSPHQLPMKSPEVYAQLRTELAPWFKANGFKRAKGLLSWSRPHGDAHVVVWCQISQDGWDNYAGSKFVVEFQRSTEPIVGAHPARRQRLASLLSPADREYVRTIQNAVIASLGRPPKSHPALQVSPSVTEWYLGQFNQVAEPYPERHDIWLRYASPQHVDQWAKFILQKLPECIGAVEAWGLTPPSSGRL